MVLVKHDLVDVEALAEHYNLSKQYFWKIFREQKLDAAQGVNKAGRLYRIDLDLFDSWLRSLKDGPDPASPPPPPLHDHQERPTRREALTALSSRLDVLQASVTAHGEKLDNLTRLVSALKLGVSHGYRTRSRS